MTSRRLFFALWPDDRQREKLRDALSPLTRQIEGTAVLRGNWHITLAFIGSFPDIGVPGLLAAADEIPVEPFRLRLDRAEYWPRPKLGVLVAKAVPPELERLVAALTRLIHAAGVEPDDRMFRPHVTFARRARSFEAQPLAQPLVTEWQDFVLLESVPEAGGVRYRPVKQ
jgi:2'-5' RNA ligase